MEAGGRRGRRRAGGLDWEMIMIGVVRFGVAYTVCIWDWESPELSDESRRRRRRRRGGCAGREPGMVCAAVRGTGDQDVQANIFFKTNIDTTLFIKQFIYYFLKNITNIFFKKE